MLDPSHYQGREQTYIKHFVLRRYLEKLAYKIGWQGIAINYVDCFAGPWQHTSEELEDTSPFIAIAELRKVRDTLREKGRQPPKIRCLFIEKDPKAYALLRSKLEAVEDIETEAINGEFEGHVKHILNFSRNTFTFFFIDPTGWTGYPLDTITPILRHQPGEVLVNFMTKFINRFVDHDRPEDVESFRRLFGSESTGYREEWAGLSGLDREDAIVQCYRERLKSVGGFKFAASATILEPVYNKAHFHLIYATRHIEGLRVFRNDAERPAGKEQRQQRWKTQSNRTHQMGLFDEPVCDTFEDSLRKRYHQKAFDRLEDLLHARRHVSFDELEVEALQFPWTSTQDLKEWLVEQKRQGVLEIEGLAPKARVPQPGKGHYVSWRGSLVDGDV